MESRPTILIAVFLVLGGAFMAMFQRGTTSPPPAATGTERNPPQNAGAAQVLAATCTTPPWPLAPLCEKFEAPVLVAAPVNGGKESAVPTRGTTAWQREAWLQQARGRTQFLIATVPDPELTRLSLYFDRAMDSIQRAAESVSFYLDRHWLPWTREGASSGSAATFTGDEPGMLLFRRPGASDEYLVVFLIGESPVSGIRQRTFLKAVQYAQAVAAPQTIYVSGTSYSGALASLRRGIEDARRLFLKTSSVKFHVVSASATVKSEMDAFAGGDAEWTGAVSFASVMHNDNFASQQFLEYVSRRWLGPIPSAFLSEGQTAYGIGSGTIRREMSRMQQQSGGIVPEQTATGKQTAAESTRAQAARTIRFPREIARLRGAYPQPGTAPRDGGAIPQGTANAQLSVPLQQVQEGRDAVTIFSGAQLPVVQEAVLLDIASTLQREDVRLAGIAATDVFDALFLTGFLRKANPSVRLYLDDADLLYVRAVSQYSLDGILAITTYPMVTHNQLWSLGRSESQWQQRSPTASRYELGVFNAARALLLLQENERLVARGAVGPPSPGRDAGEESATGYGRTDARWPDLLDHSFPGTLFETRPPLWLVTVGINGYWPIALLNHSQVDESQLSWGPGRSAARRPVLDIGRPGRVWTVVFVLLVLVGGAFGCLTVLSQLPGFLDSLQRAFPDRRPARESRLWRQFLVRPAERGAPGRAYFISAQCLALAAMLYPVASPLWLLAMESPSPANGVPYVSPENWLQMACIPSFMSFVVLLGGAITPFTLLFLHHMGPGTAPEGEGPMKGNQYIHLAVVTFVAFPFPLIFWWFGLAGNPDYSLFFFTFRSLDLLNGVSPATPFLLLGAGLFVMARLHARRHALSMEAPTVLPSLPEDFQTHGLRAGTAAVARSLANPITSDPGATMMILIPAFAIFFLIPWEWPQSLENWQYDVAYQITLRALFLLAAISWARFVLVWVKLHRVLDILNLHPLRAAFSILPSGYSQVPVLEGSGTLDSRDRLVQLAQDLRALAACPNVVKLDFLREDELRRLERRIESAIGRDHRSLAGIWRSVADIGTRLAELLEREWVKGCGTVDEAVLRRSDVPAERRAYRIAEEIVAVPYLSFLGNAMLQLRNLLFYVTTSYFLGVMSALVYPFRGVQMIVWAATIGFVVLGIPVVVAIIQMERDEILRRLTRSKEEPGALRLVKRFAVFGALPVLAMIGSYFPGIGRYLITVVEPALKAL